MYYNSDMPIVFLSGKDMYRLNKKYQSLLDEYNIQKADLSIFDGSDKNIIIYGHNTYDGSMFGTLRNILDNEWKSNKENLKITLVTEKDTYYYEVFSTYIIDPEEYYINTTFNTDNEFNKFIKTIKARSNYDYNIDLNVSDTILTLSSCSSLDGSKRIVLHAKLIK